MVILELFTKTINIKYRSTLLSKATLLVLIFGIISVVLPFIFAYKSKGFWMKRDVFYEQPDVRFKGEYIFVATTNDLNNPITCSTLPHYQKMLESLDSCSLIKVREVDKNFDGKIDEFSVNLLINLLENIQITSINIIILVDYKLHKFCPLQMQAAIIFQGFLPVPISDYSLVGDVMITQSSPIICPKNTNNIYNYSIIADVDNLDDYKIINVITEYSNRNISTKLSNVYTSFVTGNSRDFHLNLKIRYPEDKIYYKTGFWQLLKWAWIQYFAIYVIISWCITKAKHYIFSRRLVLFYEDNPVKKKQ